MLTDSQSKALAIIRDNSSDFCVVVEGKKDVQALEHLGVNNIETINAHGGPVDLIDELKERGVRRIIILTDYDRTGETLAKRVSELAEAAGIHVNNVARQKIRQLFHVRFVERLDDIVNEIRGEEIG
jgi:5S rRNA maturation endonuclease (ribonuclease M5)